jgi:TRAP-type C4-dicarboxylate transport system permease small subunit
MRIVRLIDRGITTVVTAALVFSFAVMLALAAGQVVLRQAFHGNLPWGDLAARHLVIWVGFFGAYLASRRGQHFHIGFLARLAPPRAVPWLRAVVDLFAAVICAFLVAAGWTFITVGLDPHATLFLGIRQAQAALIVPIGFLLMTLQFILRAVQDMAKGIRGELEEPEAPAGAGEASD